MIIQFTTEGAKRVAYRDQVARSGSKKARAAFEAPQALADRLWHKFAARSEAGDLSAARVLLMGFEGKALREARSMVRAVGVASCASCQDVEQLQDVAEMHGAFSHLVVNFDAFETSHEAVEALFAFRLKQRQVVVVLVSASVTADDLTAERKSICDATLRAPLSHQRTKRVLVAASMNRAANLDPN